MLPTIQTAVRCPSVATELSSLPPAVILPTRSALRHRQVTVGACKISGAGSGRGRHELTGRLVGVAVRGTPRVWRQTDHRTQATHALGAGQRISGIRLNPVRPRATDDEVAAAFAIDCIRARRSCRRPGQAGAAPRRRAWRCSPAPRRPVRRPGQTRPSADSRGWVPCVMR